MDLLLILVIALVSVLYGGLAASEYLRRSDLPKIKAPKRSPMELWQERRRSA